MKTKTWILIIGIVLILCLGLSLPMLFSRAPASHATVTGDGKLLKTVDLGIDQEFTVTSENGGINVVTVKDGKIAVTEATCPDHYCMKRLFCDSGADIVCLPNRLVIHFTEISEIDAVIG